MYIYINYLLITMTIETANFLIIMTISIELYCISLPVRMRNFAVLSAHNNYNANCKPPHNHGRPIPTCNTILIQPYNTSLRFNTRNNEP